MVLTTTGGLKLKALNLEFQTIDSKYRNEFNNPDDEGAEPWKSKKLFLSPFSGCGFRGTNHNMSHFHCFDNSVSDSFRVLVLFKS